MTNRNGIFTARIFPLFVLFLILPLLGWNTLPKLTTRGLTETREPSRTAAQRSIPAPVSAAGDAIGGGDLFMGKLHFTNGGPPCMGCHNVGSNGLLGGGAMGPDLTDVSARRTRAEILGILSNTGPIPSPVMQPIFTESPLTTEEQAALLAFLEASVGQPATNKEIIVLGISLAGFVAAVAFLGFVYRGRLRGVRRPLLKRALAEKQ